MLTFDKDDLIKLRRDILENTEKYEKMLTKDTGFYEVPDRHVPRRIKDEAWLYWYRVINDGKTPYDNVYQYKTYLAYKEFVEGIEKKALGTLQFVISRLIADFDHIEGVNHITELESALEKKGGNKDTKRQSLERLISLITDTEYVKEKPVNKGKAQQVGDNA